MKTLIIYYSAAGSTKIMARTLAMNLKADIVEIKDLKSRTGFVNKFLSSVDAFRESKTKISPSKLDLSNYDLIYIGTPTWANKPAPAIITLIDSFDLRGKDIILFTTGSTSDEEAALEKMEIKVRARGARAVQQFNLKTREKTAADLQKETEKLFKKLDLDLY